MPFHTGPCYCPPFAQPDFSISSVCNSESELFTAHFPDSFYSVSTACRIRSPLFCMFEFYPTQTSLRCYLSQDSSTTTQGRGKVLDAKNADKTRTFSWVFYNSEEADNWIWSDMKLDALGTAWRPSDLRLVERKQGEQMWGFRQELVTGQAFSCSDAPAAEPRFWGLRRIQPARRSVSALVSALWPTSIWIGQRSPFYLLNILCSQHPPPPASFTHNQCKVGIGRDGGRKNKTPFDQGFIQHFPTWLLF